jgi:hypothetical protein
MTREELHKKYGTPFPTGHSVTTDVKDKAVAIAADHKNLLIRYVRKNPKLVKDLREGEDPYNKPTYKIMKGEILGVLVAFKDDGELLIGWSKRHSTHEDLSFTREDARVCAVLRGLLDSIIIESKEKVFTSVSGQSKNRQKSLDRQYIPSPLKYHIPSFIGRSKAYFKADPTNVTK